MAALLLNNLGKNTEHSLILLTPLNQWTHAPKEERKADTGVKDTESTASPRGAGQMRKEIPPPAAEADAIQQFRKYSSN